MKIKGFSDTIAWYDKNAEQYAQTQNQIPDLDQIDLFVSKFSKGAKVLDAGCAAGRDAALFAKKGLDVEGIDLSKGLIEIAKRNYPEISFQVGNFLNLPFADEFFDGVWAHQSLLHLETVNDVTRALREFKRVLKPFGVLLVLVKAKMGSAKTAIVKDAFSNHDRFFQYFSKEELADLLTNAEFQIEHIEQFREIDRKPEGRAEVGLILALCKK